MIFFKPAVWEFIVHTEILNALSLCFLWHFSGQNDTIVLLVFFCSPMLALFYLLIFNLSLGIFTKLSYSELAIRVWRYLITLEKEGA